jgi:hypothetical protein
VTHSDLEWDKRAQRLEFDQLADLRRAAEQWRNGLAGLTGLLAAAALLRTPASFTNLTEQGKWITLPLLGLGFAALVTGSLCAMRAAFGQPGRIINAGEDLKRWTIAEGRISRRRLRAARVVTPFAIGLLGVATAVTWIDTKPMAPKSRLVVLLRDGSRICGKPQESGGGDMVLRLDTKGQETINLAFAQVASLQLGNC